MDDPLTQAEIDRRAAGRPMMAEEAAAWIERCGAQVPPWMVLQGFCDLLARVQAIETMQPPRPLAVEVQQWPRELGVRACGCPRGRPCPHDAAALGHLRPLPPVAPSPTPPDPPCAHPREALEVRDSVKKTYLCTHCQETITRA